MPVNIELRTTSDYGDEITYDFVALKRIALTTNQATVLILAQPKLQSVVAYPYAVCNHYLTILSKIVSLTCLLLQRRTISSLFLSHKQIHCTFAIADARHPHCKAAANG